MKDIVRLPEPDNIHHFTRRLWRSDIFKRSHDEGGVVHDVIDRFARLPRLFYVPSQEDIEAPHFSPWWGAIQMRNYERDAVQDLYYLHEIEHAGTMPYMPGLNLVTLKNKIRDNEHEASTLSEMTIYFDHPELRPQTFPHEIFVDRFLFPEGGHARPDPRMLERWQTEPDLVRKELMYARASVVTAKEIDPQDKPAFWLNRFANQGRAWTAIWTARYGLIEEGMTKFRDNCLKIGRSAALDQHIEWLTSPEIADGTTIPFYKEAAAFSEIYAENKRKYRENMESDSEKPISYLPTKPTASPT